MPKDPKRNIQNYQLRGGHLNEYAFQKSQGEMVQESELPFNDEIAKPNLAEATKRMAEVTAKAHRIVEQRKTRGLVKSGARKSIVSVKKSAKKVATRSAKKTTRPGTKKRAAASKRSAQKVAMKSTKKATTRPGTKKRATVKTRRQNRASNR
ncbi:MAG TPA: hypothetical protein VFH01_07205 [Pyrinomonadaceae bacterium]|nr:hypothetical protein [Pyrinomonadaceae bacterium]